MCEVIIVRRSHCAVVDPEFPLGVGVSLTRGGGGQLPVTLLDPPLLWFAETLALCFGKTCCQIEKRYENDMKVYMFRTGIKSVEKLVVRKTLLHVEYLWNMNLKTIIVMLCIYG